jgi:hypothetical protein
MVGIRGEPFSTQILFKGEEDGTNADTRFGDTRPNSSGSRGKHERMIVRKILVLWPMFGRSTNVGWYRPPGISV